MSARSLLSTTCTDPTPTSMRACRAPEWVLNSVMRPSWVRKYAMVWILLVDESILPKARPIEHGGLKEKAPIQEPLEGGSSYV